MRRDHDIWHTGSLVEAIVVIVITGIIAGMVAVFIRTPVEGYMDAERRAGLTDIADTAVRRMAREIRLALPNSVRTAADGSGRCIEFIPTKIGARYRMVVGEAMATAMFSTSPLSMAASTCCGQTVRCLRMSALPRATWSSITTAVPPVAAYSGTNAIQIGAGGVVEDRASANSTSITFVDAATACLSSASSCRASRRKDDSG